MRKGVLAVAAVLLIVQGLVLGLVGVILGAAVNQQNMSLAGLNPHAMALGAWIGEGLLGLVFVVTGVLVARAAARGAEAGTPTRILLLITAVVTGVLAAAMLALSGWPLFVLLIVLLAVFVMAILMLRDEDAPQAGGDPAQPESPAPDAPELPAEPPVAEPSSPAAEAEAPAAEAPTERLDPVTEPVPAPAPVPDPEPEDAPPARSLTAV